MTSKVFEKATADYMGKRRGMSVMAKVEEQAFVHGYSAALQKLLPVISYYAQKEQEFEMQTDVATRLLLELEGE